QEADRYAEHYRCEFGFAEAVRDADAHARVVAAMPERAPAGGDKALSRAALVAHAAAEGPQGLSAAQRHRLLGDAQALRELQERVTQHQAHPAWWLGAERRKAPRPAALPYAEPWRDAARPIAAADAPQ